ncbi:MAG TPA: cellulose synthase catalytic subunit [Candidatus Sulfomarinibacteraceae bacterium]|nr:cellulose synthase catalytic subunit [Candidatus Sulfomarinibacteraceae bacterium]
MLLVVLVGAILYSGAQLVGIWILSLAARRAADPPPPDPDLTIDVFVTACGEPPALVERSLAAACAMRGEHRTWLLDDAADPALEALAEQHGAGYLTRSDRVNRKAGNVNAALAQTDGDLVVIFDIDHVPTPDFLERTVGHFNDPEIGFVQVMLTFDNGDQSWVARSAMETSLEYYNPTSLGTDGVGAASLMGSNAVIRREALESLGGYLPGLADDLATSMALHAAGWRSTYVPEPLAPGISPPSFASWFVQQLKWARGVFELLITSYPRLFSRLTWGQRLAYITRLTRYWIGPAIAIHLIATIVVLIFGDISTKIGFHHYLLHLGPLVVFDMLIRHVSLAIWQHEATPRTSLAGAVTLVYATWPIYLLAWMMAVLRLPLAFKLTPKSGSEKLKVNWLLPQILAVVLLVWGILYTVYVANEQPSFLIMAAAVQAVLQLRLLYKWLDSESPVSRHLPRRRTKARKGSVLNNQTYRRSP